MIKQEYGKIGDKTIFVLSAESIEDAKDAGFPDGIFTCYEIDGKREFSPASVMFMVIDAVRDGKFKPAEMLQQHKIKKNHTVLITGQKIKLIDELKKMKAEYKKMGVSDDVIKSIDSQIETFSKGLNIDGVRRAG